MFVIYSTFVFDSKLPQTVKLSNNSEGFKRCKFVLNRRQKLALKTF